MPPVDTPFMITVCGLEELAGHADRQVSHVLSIWTRINLSPRPSEHMESMRGLS